MKQNNFNIIINNNTDNNNDDDNNNNNNNNNNINTCYWARGQIGMKLACAWNLFAGFLSMWPAQVWRHGPLYTKINCSVNVKVRTRHSPGVPNSHLPIHKIIIFYEQQTVCHNEVSIGRYITHLAFYRRYFVLCLSRYTCLLN